jgi:hypothetical protein
MIKHTHTSPVKLKTKAQEDSTTEFWLNMKAEDEGIQFDKVKLQSTLSMLATTK